MCPELTLFWSMASGTTWGNSTIPITSARPTAHWRQSEKRQTCSILKSLSSRHVLDAIVPLRKFILLSCFAYCIAYYVYSVVKFTVRGPLQARASSASTTAQAFWVHDTSVIAHRPRGGNVVLASAGGSGPVFHLGFEQTLTFQLSLSTPVLLKDR